MNNNVITQNRNFDKIEDAINFIVQSLNDLSESGFSISGFGVRSSGVYDAESNTRKDSFDVTIQATKNV